MKKKGRTVLKVGHLDIVYRDGAGYEVWSGSSQINGNFRCLEAAEAYANAYVAEKKEEQKLLSEKDSDPSPAQVSDSSPSM